MEYNIESIENLMRARTEADFRRIIAQREMDHIDEEIRKRTKSGYRKDFPDLGVSLIYAEPHVKTRVDIIAVKTKYPKIAEECRVTYTVKGRIQVQSYTGDINNEQN